jgi:hypothetical protein
VTARAAPNELRVDLFRVSRDIYGREVLQGMSWDLLWVFFGLGCVLILGHALYRWLLAPKPH